MPSIERLGRYEIRRELGRGAMGVVYEGYDPTIKRVVAIKTIRADQLAGEEAAVVLARFRREAQAAGRLSHPNIVAIYDCDEDDGTSYIAMELVEGRELKQCFEANERFTTADAVRLMGQVLDALEYSHARGVIHRDIKPSNVFLQPDGSLKVADFGIAHIESSNLTQVGTVIGTPSYMSPEQIMGLPVDARSDLFSAGVMLYQFLTGERPFSGSSTTVIQKVLKEEPLPPSTLNVQLSDAMDAVVRRALAKRADERFQTAAEFARAMRAAVGARTSETLAPAARISDADATEPHLPATPAASAGARTATAPQPAAAVTIAARPRKAAATIVAVAAVVAVAAGAWLFVQVKPDRAMTAVQPAPAARPDAVGTAPTRSIAGATPQPTPAAPASTAPAADPGSLVISAVGLVDPGQARYQGDASLLAADLRADARAQLVEKALGMLIDRASLAKHYGVLNDRLLAHSGDYIGTVVRESEPRTGKDGLVSIRTEAVVNVKAVQKSLNQMTRTERIDIIRAQGDPRISVRIMVRDADRPDAPAQPSPVAENLLKERIKSFGFRTWSDDGSDAAKAADFAVIGEARIRRLSTRLEASGITVTKFAVASWTVKGVDRASGEEIYFNTAMPKGSGSWASEEEALKAIGARIADEFSRELFLSHVNATSQRVTLTIEGLPDSATAELLSREFPSLAAVISARPRAGGGARAFDLELAGTGPVAELVAAGVLAPLNAKFGQACLTLGASAGRDVAAAFEARCNEPGVLSRLETNPPAGLYGAPLGRRNALIQNPETLRKLSI